jgi:hypothetical protein
MKNQKIMFSSAGLVFFLKILGNIKEEECLFFFLKMNDFYTRKQRKCKIASFDWLVMLGELYTPSSIEKSEEDENL